MKLFFVLAFTLVLSSCGIKGKPLPPLPEEPLAATEEKAEAVSQPTTVQPLKTIPAKKKKSN
ncbi:hypothetical protein [Pseudobdellovibrio sp. HCB154]|uniref:hypothetical protein n=1 Tax=Pseudobdellovibrio sp. HCB154 TaxID=3386277 RepID=UPI003916F3BB